MGPFYYEALKMNPKTIRLYFPFDAFYKDTQNPIYLKGSTHDVTTESDFALRWLKRGAVEVKEEIKLEVKEAVIVEDVVEEKVVKEQPKVHNKNKQTRK